MKFYVVVVGLFLSLASYGAGAGADKEAEGLGSLEKLPEQALQCLLPYLPKQPLGRLAQVNKAWRDQVRAEREHRLRVYLTGGRPRPQGLEMMPGVATFLCDRNQAQQVQDYIDYLPEFPNIFGAHVKDHGRPYVVSRDMPLHAAFESVPAIQQENLLELLTAHVGNLCSLETSFDFLKAALTHHLGHDYSIYSVFGTEAVLREWSSNLTSWCEHLAGIISRGYVAFDPQNWDPAGAKGKHVVVDRGVLDNRAHVRTLNRFFREAENQPQSLIVNVLGATTLNMGEDNIPESVHNLMVTNTDGSVTQIGDEFLWMCRELTVLDLKALANVTRVGHGFLNGCSGLTELDLSALSNVTTIGNYFLSGCGLKVLDLSSLSKVTTIGDYFLSGCRRLNVLDLSALSNVTAIGDRFLMDCTWLTAVKLNLPNLTTIGDRFLDDCSVLTELDLSALSNVTTIGNYFLSGCGLTELDLSALSNVTRVGNCFLYNCRGLTAVKLNLPNLTTIGDYFLLGCSGLTAVKLNLPNLTTIGERFLESCIELTAVDLSALSNVTAIGYRFLGHCSELKVLDLSALSKVTRVGQHFLDGCREDLRVIYPEGWTHPRPY